MNEGIHIAIIPDGNRRWAKKKRKPTIYGHQKGAETLENVLKWSAEYPEIKMISIYALSTENLNRTKKELMGLWNVYKSNLEKILSSEEIKKNQIRVKILGDYKLWDSDTKKVAKEVMTNTKNYGKSVLNILLAYGGKFEIMNSINSLLRNKSKKIPVAGKIFEDFLMVKKPVDLVIRTGGQHRLSNFLLYQAAYSEIYFTDTLWPDFDKREFNKIMKWYHKQQKKLGK
ncbi:MAG: di-trans,poly-cis-decaprenylcistransferase [Nanoarchaeota archaeon]|nr:di-trans,poly-cis-decaprenylcistransferase [Nanoarchaeota archaeon]